MVVPEWNKHNTTTIETIFEFSNAFLNNNVFIILFNLECKDVSEDVCTYLAMYDFTIMRDWWGVNVMKLWCGFNVSAISSHPFKSCQL